MVDANPSLLSLRSAGLRDLDPCNLDEVHNMWAAFSRAKNCIDGGARLEYLSWRIYSREFLVRHPSTSDLDACARSDTTAPDTVTAEVATNNTPASTEDEWETDSNDDLDERVLSSARVPALVKSKPRRHSASHKSVPHRRISSIELQHLFKDTPKLDAVSLKGACSTVPKHPAPKNTHTSHASSSEDSGHEAKSTNGHSKDHGADELLSQSSQLALAAYKNAYMSTPPGIARTGPKDIGAPHQMVPSMTVRGFSPTSISVSLNRRPSVPTTLSNPSGESLDTGSFISAESIDMERNDSSSEKVLSERKKIFFIGAADSESDEASSIAGSGDATLHGFGNGLVAGSSTTAAHENDGGEDDGWDDTSDEGDEEEEMIEHRKNMFKEKVVEMKPPLKRSLLSTLFVNQVKDPVPTSKLAQLRTGRKSKRTSSSSSSNTITAPVDILLGAAVAPHIPISIAGSVTNQSDTNIMIPEEPIIFDDKARGGGPPAEGRSRHELDSMSLRNRRLTQSASYDEPTSKHATQSVRPPDPRLVNITVRPEMYRASTDPTQTGHSSLTDKGSNWKNQHEDIYDPLNYHSRGW